MFQKINKTLLEKYPSIWNTKLVGMLFITLSLHVLYFLFGLLRFISPELLDKWFSSYEGVGEFTNPLNYIIIILLIVVWLAQMFKNNAFKSYYPQSNKVLFGQYLQYIIILFSIISLPLSFTLGYKTFLNIKYPDATVTQYQKNYKDALVFRLNNTNNYLPSERRYPQPFDTLISVTDKKEGFPTIEFDGNDLQYFQPIRKTYKQDYSSISLDQLKQKAYNVEQNDTFVWTIEYGPYVDMSKEIILNYSLYNYSNYSAQDESSYGYYDEDYTTNNKPINDRKRVAYNKYVYELLNRNDKKEIEQILENFLALSKVLKIDQGIEANRWMELVYHPPLFIVDSFIRTNEDINGTPDIIYAPTEAATTVSGIDEAANAITINRLTKDRIYLEYESIKNILDNITLLKTWGLVHSAVLVYLCIAVGLAQILLAFRTTSGKHILFGIIVSCILTLIIALFSLGVLEGSNTELPLLYLLFFIALLLIIVPIISTEKNNKFSIGIMVVMSTTLLPYFWLLVWGMIHGHEELYMKQKYGLEYYYKHDYPLSELTPFIPYIIIILTIVSTYFYLQVIKKWKAMPEA